MRLYTISSSLHKGQVCSVADDPFINGVEVASGFLFDLRKDFSSYGSEGDDDVIYIRTGGVEGIFRALFEKGGMLFIPGGKPVKLLASGQDNSLAAAMEILTYLKQRGVDGEILYGSDRRIASILNSRVIPQICNDIHEIGTHTAELLDGVRLGVVGKPSDWLISSEVDYAAAKSVLGAEIVDIEMADFMDEMGKGGYSLPNSLILPDLNIPRYGKPFAEGDLKKSLEIYGALRRICAKYRLDGLSMRCFDLLTNVRGTACLALAILNSEGITATCEGDVPAMLSMAISEKLCGISGFQANLSRIDGNQFLFAHCSVPLNIVGKYCFDRHFESGIGIGIHGEFISGPATVFKIGSDLKHFMAEDVEIKDNRFLDSLCRTQVIVEGKGLKDYFLRSPLGNHHIIIPGRHAETLRAALWSVD